MKTLPPVKKNARYFLSRWRAEHDLTQADAAARFGVSASHWSLIEDGRRAFSGQLAVRIAKVTGCPLEVLVVKNKAVRGNHGE